MCCSNWGSSRGSEGWRQLLSTLSCSELSAGRFDIYVHGKQKLWDYAAGALILEEAGGRLACLEGAFDDGEIWERSVVASASPALFEQWQAWLAAQGQ